MTTNQQFEDRKGRACLDPKRTTIKKSKTAQKFHILESTCEKLTFFERLNNLSPTPFRLSSRLSLADVKSPPGPFFSCEVLDVPACTVSQAGERGLK